MQKCVKIEFTAHHISKVHVDLCAHSSAIMPIFPLLHEMKFTTNLASSAVGNRSVNQHAQLSGDKVVFFAEKYEF